MSELETLCLERGVTTTAVYHGVKPQLEPMGSMLHWTVTLHYCGRKMSLDYHAGIGHAKDPPNGYKGMQKSQWRNDRSAWGVRLRKEWLANPKCAVTPSPADVLSCVCSDARAGEMSFEDFASEFGYDSDSRKAYAVWESCRDMCIKARVLLGADFDTFANAEH
jgi:hypothetical protein